MQELESKLRVDVEYGGEVSKADLVKVAVGDRRYGVARLAHGGASMAIGYTNHRLSPVLSWDRRRRRLPRQIHVLHAVAEDVAFSCQQTQHKQK